MSTPRLSATPQLISHRLDLPDGIDCPVEHLLLVAGPLGLRAVLWPNDLDGSRAKHRVPLHSTTEGTSEVIELSAKQLTQYFLGGRTEFDLPLDPIGTPFQKEVWFGLARIPFGQTTSYGKQAVELGRPSAVRAVASANGRNPLSIVLPCHRIVGADGSLTGFAAGLEAKAWLLRHEGSALFA
ncbi:MAG: methylated-DNA--[protein]-cysteine S-methyltransferase [Actinomycetota bacterium]|nr:methylated-DNA--[protein]-cysteine S-methyltransferase [Actinomycetota bacterium]